MTSETLVAATGLRKSFGGVTAVSDLGFEIRSDEVVGIIGPNGSGKTTFFNILSGFMRPDAGSVAWRGKDISRTPAHLRSRLGLVRTFQQAMAFDDLTVREHRDGRAHGTVDRGHLPQRGGASRLCSPWSRGA